MPTIKTPLSFVTLFAIALFGLTDVSAQNSNWTGNGTTNDYFDNANWTDGVPEPETTAGFLLSPLYSVDLTGSAEVNVLNVVNGQLTFFGGSEMNAVDAIVDNCICRISGAGTRLRSDSDLTIGSTSAANLYAESGGEISVLGSIYLKLGRLILEPGTTGDADHLELGNAPPDIPSNGSVTICSSSCLTTNTAVVGQNVASANPVFVEPGGQWSNNGAVVVGELGNGSLFLEGKANVGELSAATNILSSSLIDVVGDLASSGDITIGGQGSATLVIRETGLVSADNVVVAEDDFFGNALVTVESGVLDVCGNLTIGNFGDVRFVDGAQAIVDGQITVAEFGQIVLTNGSVVTGDIACAGEFFVTGSSISAMSGNLTFTGSAFAQIAGGLSISGSWSNDGDDTVILSAGEVVVSGPYSGTAPLSGSGLVKFADWIRPGNSLSPTTFANFGSNVVDLTGSSKLEIQIGGTSNGQFDRIRSSSVINIMAGASLEVETIGGFEVMPGQSFTIIVRSSSSTTQFAGLPEGGEFSVGDATFSISYVGGAGANVVITAQGVLLGDVNLDEVVNLLDVAPFVDRISSGIYQTEADTNEDGMVNLLDVQPFVNILSM